MNVLLDQLNGIAAQTNYNGVSLLQNSGTDKTARAALIFQVGEKDSNTIATASSVRVNDIGLGLAGTKAVVNNGSITVTEARAGLKIVDNAIAKLNKFRSDFGSTKNQIKSIARIY
jgi:flagellin